MVAPRGLDDAVGGCRRGGPRRSLRRSQARRRDHHHAADSRHHRRCDDGWAVCSVRCPPTRPGCRWPPSGPKQPSDWRTKRWTRRPGVSFVDAPVSGSREPAEKGQLLILASGPPQAAAALEPVFAVLGRATLWLGPAGAGSRMKLVLNTWLAFQVEGAAEVAALASHLGVAASGLLDALRGNPLASPYALAKLAKMLEQDDHADFSLDLALKDLDLATSEAGTGVVPLAEAIAERWRGLVTTGRVGSM